MLVGHRVLLQGKVLATPVQHIIRTHRRLALLEWRIETRAKRVLTLPRIIHPGNVEMKTVVASRGQRMNSHSAAGGVGASPGLNCKNLLNKAFVRSCRKNRKTR